MTINDGKTGPTTRESDMLVLPTPLYRRHTDAREVGTHNQRTTDDFLQMQHGSLYPALHWLNGGDA
jgi:DNA-binding PadR family transcriptional regulator